MVQLNAALRRVGFTTPLIVTRQRHEDRQQGSGRAGVQSHRSLGPRRLGFSPGQALAVLRLSRRARFLHSHGLYLTHNLWTYLAHRLWAVPYSVQLHGVLEPYQRGEHVRQKAIWDAVFGNRFLRDASWILAASPSEAARLPDTIPKHKIHVIALGSPPEPDAARGLWLARPQHKQVIFLGRLAKKKRLDLLLAAWVDVACAVPEARLAIAGSGAEEGSLAQTITSLALNGSVSLVGHVDGDEKDDFLRRASLFVLPSDNENFGLAVIEALTYALPVVLSDGVAVASDVIRSGAGWLVPADDREALCAALVAALNASREELEERGSAAQSYAAAHYDWLSAAKAVVTAHGAVEH
jgi:glycosyltransferase involved in cell wall biosynthesis